ncbi:DDE-type integrase/transposase/recombinase [Muricoccus radiodurans]|uniref:DDE-type integrase/transposase/recombinase n=1 Tax=Muricoccus radiodurans TaxID=2231721 RepID=UPI003CE6C792
MIAPTSNLRWSSDGLEIPCWNGEVVRLAFAIDTHDREVMAWVATTGGISGEMIRDLMLACVERRFAALRAPHPLQCLADSGSAYAAHDTRSRLRARCHNVGAAGRWSGESSACRPGAGKCFLVRNENR